MFKDFFIVFTIQNVPIKFKEKNIERFRNC